MGTATQRKNVTVQLGGFNVVCNVESALEGTKEVSLNNLCCGPVGGETHGPAQTRQQLKCPVCDNADRDTFAKGKDMGAGRFVVVPPEVLEQAGAEGGSNTSIEIFAHPREQVGRSLNGEKCYFLVPANAASAESYALIAAAIAARSDVAFVTKWAVRSASAMYQIDNLDGRLVMKQLAWPGSVRALPEVPAAYNEKFFEIATQLIDAMITDYDISVYVDAKSKVITEFLEQADTVAGALVDAEAGPVNVPSVDVGANLMAALAKLGAEAPPVQPLPAEVPDNVEVIKPARKTAAKTATTRKTAAKKATTKTA